MINSSEIERKFKGKKAVVTGGAGFVGSWVANMLLQFGCNVTVIDDLSTGKPKNLNMESKRLQLIKADISRPTSFSKINGSVDYIFHIAAIASVPESVRNPRRTFDVNDKGTFNLLEWMRKSAKDACMVFASSAAVYGEPRYVPVNEAHPPVPISPYGASKLAGEAHCIAFNKAFGTKVVILRLFNIYGPRQPRYVIYDFLHKILTSRTGKLAILGSGRQIRDFTYAADAAECFLSAAIAKEAICEQINIGNGGSISVTNLAKKMLQILGMRLQLEFTNESWKGDVMTFIADNSKAKKLLCFEPKVSIDEGLKEEIQWFKEEYA